MSVVLKGHPIPPIGLPEEPDIAVIFTSIEATLTALRVAGLIGPNHRTRLTLVVPHIVPYSRSLTSPSIAPRIDRRYFRVHVGRRTVHAKVRILPCRDRETALREVLKPHSTVVIGDSGHWWATSEKRLARTLRGAGHHVIIAKA
jgi:hypothetical protein